MKMEEKMKFTDQHCVKMNGPLGKALDHCIVNQLLTCDAELLSEPFRTHADCDGGWRGEFWGKVIRSAILAWRSTRNAELLAWIERAMFHLMNSIAPDGSISSAPDNARCSGWDVWGRKYVLIGLERYYNEVEAREDVKEAVSKVLDSVTHDIHTFCRNGEIRASGQHEGLAASSILGGVVGAWRMTNESRHLDFAKEIVTKGCSGRHNIFTAARLNIPPAETGNGKAYEMMSCYKGASEMLDELSEEYLEAIVNFWKLVSEREILANGTAGGTVFGEYWFDGRFRQTLPPEFSRLGETCVTVTWIQYSGRILELTGNSNAADAMEFSAYNALLGSFHPNGSAWCHGNPTPLAGPACKRPAGDQIFRNFGQYFDNHDCCRAQGPEGLAQMSHYTLMRQNDGIAINFYEAFEGCAETPSGMAVKISAKGGYPFKDDVEIDMAMEKAEKFALYLRIPAWWNDKSYLEIGNEKLTAGAGQYFRIEREWQKNEVIRIHFDMTPRLDILPNDSRYCSVISGPVVMVQSSRLDNFNGKLPSGTPEVVEHADFRKVFKYPDGGMLCDYASAGDRFAEDDLFQVILRCDN